MTFPRATLVPLAHDLTETQTELSCQTVTEMCQAASKTLTRNTWDISLGNFTSRTLAWGLHRRLEPLDLWHGDFRLWIVSLRTEMRDVCIGIFALGSPSRDIGLRILGFELALDLWIGVLCFTFLALDLWLGLQLDLWLSMFGLDLWLWIFGFTLNPWLEIYCFGSLALESFGSIGLGSWAWGSWGTEKLKNNSPVNQVRAGCVGTLVRCQRATH